MSNFSRSGLLHVSDLFVMGAGLIMEGNVLFNWLDRQGYGPLGASGVSMGGHVSTCIQSLCINIQIQLHTEFGLCSLYPPEPAM